MSKSVENVVVTIGKVASQDHLPAAVREAYQQADAVEVRGCSDDTWICQEFAKLGGLVTATSKLRDDVWLCTFKEADMKNRVLDAKLEFKGKEVEINEVGVPTWRFSLQGLAVFTRDEMEKSLEGKVDLISMKPEVKRDVVTFEGKKVVISRATGLWVIKVKNPVGPIEKLKWVTIRGVRVPLSSYDGCHICYETSHLKGKCPKRAASGGKGAGDAKRAKTSNSSEAKESELTPEDVDKYVAGASNISVGRPAGKDDGVTTKERRKSTQKGILRNLISY